LLVGVNKVFMVLPENRQQTMFVLKYTVSPIFDEMHFSLEFSRVVTIDDQSKHTRLYGSHLASKYSQHLL